MTVLCPYCMGAAQLVAGTRIHPHRPDLADRPFWHCALCDAWVGVHPGTTKPLGRLADRDLRRAKMLAHLVFDAIWKSKQMTRHQAYAWLASELGIENTRCHIGDFDTETCKQVVAICHARRMRIKRVAKSSR